MDARSKRRHGSTYRLGYPAIVASLFVLPVTALAQEIYVGAGYGWTENKDIGFGDDSDQGWKAFVGGTAGRYLGWEAGYVDLGEFGGAGLGKVEAQGYNIDLLARIPAGPVTPFVKVGGFYADVDGIGRSDQSWELKYGAGVGYDFTPRFGVRAEYERYQIDNNDALPNESNVDMASISLIGKFPAP